MSKEHAPLSRKEEEEKKAAEAQQQSGFSSGKSETAFNRWMNKRSPLGSGSRFKKKSQVSQPGDASEVQADAVAKAVTEGNANAAQVELQNDVVSGESITAKASDVTIETPPGFDEQIEKMKGGGLPLPDDKKSNLEEMLGTDLDHVRLHTGADAAELSDQINALAFATGDDIFYPGDLNDEELLAHEVTHTLLGGGNVISGKISRQDDPSLTSKIFFSHWFKDISDAEQILHGKKSILPNDNTNSELINRIKQAMHELEIMDADNLVLNGVYDFNLCICIYKFKHESFTSFANDPSRYDYAAVRNWMTTANLIIDSAFIEKLDGYMYAKEFAVNLIYPDTVIHRPVRTLKPGRNAWGKDYDLLFWVKSKNVSIYDEEYADSDIIEVFPGDNYIDVIDEYYFAKNSQWILVEYNDVRGYIEAKHFDFDKFIWSNWRNQLRIEATEFESRSLLISGRPIPFLPPAEVKLNGDPFKVHAGFSTISYKYIGSTYKSEEHSYFTIQLEYNGSGYASAYKTTIDYTLDELKINKEVPQFQIVTEITGNTDSVSIRLKLDSLVANAYIKPSYAAGWIDKFITIKDIVKPHTGWTPAASEHTFLDESDNSKLNQVTVVPWGAMRNDGTKKGTADEIDYDQIYFQQYLKGEDSIMLCIALIDEMSLPMNALSPDDPFAGKTMVTSAYSFGELKKNLMDDLRDSKITKKYDNRSVEIHKMLSKTKLMVYSILPVIFSEEADSEGVKNDAMRIRTALESICSLSYHQMDSAKSKMIAAENDYKYLTEKLSGLQLQQGGGMKNSLSQLVDTFNDVVAAPDYSAYYWNVRGLVDTNLREHTTSYKHQRALFFSNPDMSQTILKDPGYPTISMAHLSFLVTLLSVECSLYNFKILESIVSGNWFYGSSDDAALMANRHEDFKNMLMRIEYGINKPEFTLNYLLDSEYKNFKALFYEDSNFAKAMKAFNTSLEKNYKFLAEQESSNEWVKSILINVIIFIIAEIVTMGLATVASPAFIAAIGGVTVFRIVGTALIATTLSQSVNYMRFGTTGANFFEELGMNLLTAGILRYTGLKFNMWKPAGKLLTAAKWTAEQAVVLGSLQLIAEAHHLIKEGKLMKRDERLRTLFANAFLHFSSKLTNHIMKNPIEQAYSKVGWEIVTLNMDKLNPYRIELNQLHAEILLMHAEMIKTGEFNGLLMEKIINYRAKGIEYQEMVLRLAKKTMSKNQVKEMRKQYEAENKKLDDFMINLSKEMKLQGLIVDESASQSGWIEPVGNDTYLIDQGDVTAFQKYYSDNSGTFELIDPANPDLYVATINGRKSYFKATTGVKNLGITYRGVSSAKTELKALFKSNGDLAMFEPAGYKSLVKYAFYRRSEQPDFTFEDFKAEILKVRQKSLDTEFTPTELKEMQNAFKELELLRDESMLRDFMLNPTRRENIMSRTTTDANRLELNTAFGDDIFVLSDALTAYGEDALLRIVRHNAPTTINMPQAEFNRMIKIAIDGGRNTPEAKVIEFMDKVKAYFATPHPLCNISSWATVMEWAEAFSRYDSSKSILSDHLGDPAKLNILYQELITFTDASTRLIDISEYGVHHYKKGHTWENYSFRDANINRHHTSSLYNEGILESEIIADIRGCLNDPTFKADIALSITNGDASIQRVVNYRGITFQLTIRFSNNQVTQFFPVSGPGITPINKSILTAYKALYNL